MISGIKKIFSSRKSRPDYEHDIILTGLPRSGTTLACKLLSQAPNVIGLNEPLDRTLFDNAPIASSNIDHSFVKFRKSLLDNGTALARTSQGKVTDNAYDVNEKGERKRAVERTEVSFDKELSEDFTLVMKHCAEFSLILPLLKEKFKCYALVRNPIAVLGSWNSVNVPVSRGKVAKSGKLNNGFHEALQIIEGLEEKQLFILDWYCQQFKLLEQGHVLKYEEMMASNGHNLAVIDPALEQLKDPLESRNKSALYDKEYLKSIGTKLLNSNNACFSFYGKEEVRALLEEMVT